jgi:hypothetical protein
MSTYCLLNSLISFYRWKLHMPQPHGVIYQHVALAHACLKREVV